MKSAPVKFVYLKSVSIKIAFLRLAASKFPQYKLTLVKFAFVRLASHKLVLFKLEPLKLASDKSAFHYSELLKLTLINLAFRKIILSDKLIPLKSKSLNSIPEKSLSPFSYLFKNSFTSISITSEYYLISVVTFALFNRILFKCIFNENIRRSPITKIPKTPTKQESLSQTQPSKFLQFLKS